jgi:hypothetical protein
MNLLLEDAPFVKNALLTFLYFRFIIELLSLCLLYEKER